MADSTNLEVPQAPADASRDTISAAPGAGSTTETVAPMLDVHAPHEPMHTWRAFFIHIATIVVGLFIAVALEQLVEEIGRRHERMALRSDLSKETQQIIGDARGAAAAHLYELRWLSTRIAQAQLAIRDHRPIGSGASNDMPNYASPDIPIWRSAKAGGRVALLSKEEVSAYAEIEYVQAHVEELEAAKSAARIAVRSYNRQFPSDAAGEPDFSLATPEDLRTYLGLLTRAYEAIDAYVHWLGILEGAEITVGEGRLSLGEIFASERKHGGGEVLKNYL